MNVPERHLPNELPPDDAPSEALLWLAVQYYLGELSPEQTQAFQARLEHDPAAQHALAEAAQLCLHVETALAATPSAQPAAMASGTGSWWPAVLSIAAVVLLVVGVWPFGLAPAPERHRFSRTTPLSGNQDAALVQAWVRLQLQSPEAAAAEASFGEDDAESETPLPEAEEDPGESVVLAVPQWMLVALDARGEPAGENMMTP